MQAEQLTVAYCLRWVSLAVANSKQESRESQSLKWKDFCLPED